MNAFEMDRRIFQQYSHHKFLENIFRTRAADESEFVEYFNKKKAKLLMATSLLLQFLMLSCKAVHLKERQMLREITGGAPMVTRHGQRKNLKIG